MGDVEEIRQERGESVTDLYRSDLWLESRRNNVMLKLIKYELIKQKTSKVIIGAILALLEVVFLAGMLLGKEEIMAIAAGMLTFLASVTFVIVGLEEIITYYHDLRDKSGYMLS